MLSKAQLSVLKTMEEGGKLRTHDGASLVDKAGLTSRVHSATFKALEREKFIRLIPRKMGDWFAYWELTNEGRAALSQKGEEESHAE